MAQETRGVEARDAKASPETLQARMHEQFPGAPSRLRLYLIVSFGTTLVACGVYFFKFPNHFSIGGVAGMSVLLSALIPQVSAPSFALILNIVLLIVGFIFFGRSFGMMTAWASILMSLELKLFEWWLPLAEPLTDQPTLELLFAVLLPGVGAAMLFNIGASSGGTDVIAMILRRFTALDIGRALLLSDILITLLVFPLFGVRIGLFSVMGLFLKTTLIDGVIENLRIHKSFIIITTKADEITHFIMRTLHRGATVSEARGAFTGEPRSLIVTIMTRREAVLLQHFVRGADPGAFLSITNTSSIIGKGFRGEN